MHSIEMKGFARLITNTNTDVNAFPMPVDIEYRKFLTFDNGHDNPYSQVVYPIIVQTGTLVNTHSEKSYSTTILYIVWCVYTSLRRRNSCEKKHNLARGRVSTRHAFTHLTTI